MKNIDFDFGDRWNMSLMTLQRIDQLLKDCQKYSINNHLLGFKQNMLELYKESNAWLNTEEKKRAVKFWDKIISHKFSKDDDDNIIYPDDLKKDLDDFDFWIRNKLHKKKVTFDSKDMNTKRGLQSLDKKYGLEAD